MKDADGDLWRKEAESLRLLARKARDEPARRALLSLANEYDDLAVEAFQDAVHHSSLGVGEGRRIGDRRSACGTIAAPIPLAMVAPRGENCS